MGDEIGNDVAPISRRTRTLLAGLVAAALVVAGVMALRRGVDPVAVAPPASPPAVQMPSLPGQLVLPTPTGPLPPVPALSVGTVCPARTDGRTRLDVSFTVVNTLDEPVVLVRAEPRFPLSGLRSISTQVRTGSCASPGPPVHTDAVPGRGTVLVVFLLGLPPTCPSPLPVGATLHERRGTHSVSADVPLFNDLGSVHFATC